MVYATKLAHATWEPTPGFDHYKAQIDALAADPNLCPDVFIGQTPTPGNMGLVGMAHHFNWTRISDNGELFALGVFITTGPTVAVYYGPNPGDLKLEQLVHPFLVGYGNESHAAAIHGSVTSSEPTMKLLARLPGLTLDDTGRALYCLEWAQLNGTDLVTHQPIYSAEALMAQDETLLALLGISMDHVGLEWK